MLRNKWQDPSLSPQLLQEGAIICPGLDKGLIHCTLHLWELLPQPLWEEVSNILPLPSILPAVSQTSSAGAWIYTSESTLRFMDLSDHSLNHCILLTSILLCGLEPHKLWGTSNNHFVSYKLHFWLWHSVSITRCETAGKLFLLSPIYCWPLQHVESCTFWCDFLPWPFWPCNVSDRLPFGHGVQDLHAVFQIWSTLNLPRDVIMLSVPYTPDVASALLSMAATWACRTTISPDFMVTIVLHSHAE